MPSKAVQENERQDPWAIPTCLACGPGPWHSRTTGTPVSRAIEQTAYRGQTMQSRRSRECRGCLALHSQRLICVIGSSSNESTLGVVSRLVRRLGPGRRRRRTAPALQSVPLKGVGPWEGQEPGGAAASAARARPPFLQSRSAAFSESSTRTRTSSFHGPPGTPEAMPGASRSMCQRTRSCTADRDS